MDTPCLELLSDNLRGHGEHSGRDMFSTSEAMEGTNSHKYHIFRLHAAWSELGTQHSDV